MNGKLAKRVRKAIKREGLEKETTYFKLPNGQIVKGACDKLLSDKLKDTLHNKNSNGFYAYKQGVKFVPPQEKKE